MEIQLSVSIQLDPESWDLVYGTGVEEDDVREDVSTYVETLIHESVFQSTGDAPLVDVERVR